jgi:hypothetical protein
VSVAQSEGGVCINCVGGVAGWVGWVVDVWRVVRGAVVMGRTTSERGWRQQQSMVMKGVGNSRWRWYAGRAEVEGGR